MKIKDLGDVDSPATDLKSFGYGKPIFIELEVNGLTKKIVLGTLKGDSFGHDFSYDRARNILLAHKTFNTLPKHVTSIDAGAFLKDGSITSLGAFEEFFQITNFIKGVEYSQDLNRIMNTNRLNKLDLKRCKTLSDYLVEIHQKKSSIKEYYTRRIRDLIGDGEGIMGLIDNYPKDFYYFHGIQFKEIEKKCIEWRWKLKDREERLSQIHGDYHPWNILFRRGIDFSLIDRSRGEWGEPCDDIAALTTNYIFYSLQAYGSLKGPFKTLFDFFINNYLEQTCDDEISEVIQPFYVWRSLVVASPIWYPNTSINVRKKLFNFIFNLLDTEKIIFKKINSYF